MVKVKVVVALFSKKNFVSLQRIIYKPILILFQINIEYGNVFNRFKFGRSRAKVKVTEAIFKKYCHRSSAFIYGSISI